jgi:hypothetical protein
MLQDIVKMLEELSVSLPRFKAYEKNLPMDEPLESALIDVYTEVICFCARIISFFRTHPRREYLPALQKDQLTGYSADGSPRLAQIQGRAFANN